MHPSTSATFLDTSRRAATPVEGPQGKPVAPACGTTTSVTCYAGNCRFVCIYCKKTVVPAYDYASTRANSFSSWLDERFIVTPPQSPEKQNKNSLNKNDSSFRPQSGSSDVFDVLDYVEDTLKGLPIWGQLPVLTSEWIMHHIEMSVLLYRDLKKSRDDEDIIRALLHAIKHHFGVNSIIMTSVRSISTLSRIAYEEIFPHNPQGGAEESLNSVVRDLDRLTSSQALALFTKLCGFLMSLSCFKEYNINPLTDTKLFRDYTKLLTSSPITFSVEGLKTSLQFIQCMLLNAKKFWITGDARDLVFTSSRLTDWFSLQEKVTRDFAVIGNPEPFGISVETFQKELEQCISEGQYLSKNRSLLEGCETFAFDKRLSMLRCLERDFKMRQLAQSSRAPPCSLLIYGPSCVGKTSVMQILFKHFAKVSTLLNRPLDMGDEFCYNRCVADEYWSGFSSYQWCIMLDDVAVALPSKSVDDPTLQEIIRVVNPSPWTPPQAELERKGVYPVEPKLFLASTNVKDLNASQWFSCPIALQRRFPYIITVIPRPEFSKSSQHSTNPMLDTQKLIQSDGYDDFWLFKVEETIPGERIGSNPNRVGASFVLVGENWNLNQLLQWYGKVIQKHYENRDALARAFDTYGQAPMCPDCFGTCSGECGQTTFEPECGIATAAFSYLLAIWSCIFWDIIATWCVSILFPNPIGVTIAVQNCLRIYILAFYSTMTTSRLVGYSAAIAGIWSYLIGAAAWPAFGPLFFILTKYFDLLPHLIFVECVKTANIFGREWFNNVPGYRVPEIFLRALHRTMLVSKTQWTRWHHEIARRLFGYFTKRAVLQAANRLKAKFYDQSLATKLGVFATLAASAYLVYRLASKGFSLVTDLTLRTKPVQEEGGSFSSHQPQPKDERSNVWAWKEAPTLSSYDLSRQLLSRKGISEEAQLRAFEGNCFYFTIEGDSKTIFGRALGVGGQIYLTNAHFFWDEPSSMTISKCNPASAVGFRRHFRLSYGVNIHLYPELDLCVFCVPDLPNNPHLLEYMLEEDIQLPITNGYRIRRESDGSATIDRHINITAEVSNMLLPDNAGSLKINVFRSKTSRPTEDGDCGSPLFATFDNRLILVGIHVGGKSILGSSRAYSTRLNRKLVKKLISVFPPQRRLQPGVPILHSDKTGTIVPQAQINLKSPFRFLKDTGSMEFFGSFKFVDGQGSKVGFTYLCEQFITATAEDHHLAILDHTRPPMMRGYIPKHATLDYAMQTYDNVDYKILEDCKQGYLRDVLRNLSPSELELIKPLDLATAINGADGVSYLDAMKRSTSAGFPWCETKLKHLIPICSEDGTPTDKVDITPEMHARVADILEKYAEGIQYHPIFRANLKDEPVSIKKAENGSTRVFSCAPMDFSIIMRKFLLPCVRVIQRNALNFELAVGVQAQSYEWHRVYEHIVKHGTDRIIAGDYSKFDKRMSPCFILAAFDILRDICQKAGYTDLELRAIDCIAHDVAFPTTDFFGDFVRFFGTNPSGHPLTVIINSIVNSLYMRYAYYLLSPENNVDLFREHVSLVTYGDDNIMSVSPRALFFTHTSVSKTLYKIGVEYTMADKETESKAFISIDEASFLKRKFVFDTDLNAMVGPLDHKSICKMLTRCVKGKNYVPEQHMLSVIKSALDEYFWYGRKIFENRREKFFTISRDAGLNEYIDTFDPFPRWDELFNRYCEASIPFGYEHRGGVGTENPARQSEIQVPTLVPQSGESQLPYVQRISSVEDRPIQAYRASEVLIIDYAQTGGGTPILDGNGVSVNNPSSNNNDTNSMGTTTPAMPIDVPTNTGVPQSELVTGYSQQQQTTQFSDNSMEALYTQPHATDPTFCMDKIAIGELGDFLSRPTLVRTTTWIQGTPLTTVSTNVWSAFFNAPPILRKIENYAFFQGEIHIKLMINSSPFNYGALLAAYEPLTAFGYDLSSSSPASALRTCEFSQFPHVWLLPQNSQGGEIVFPFMYDLDWLDITSATEVSRMGTLHLFEVTPLSSANGSVGQDVDIQVYVWFEKVEMSGLTHKAPMQMGYLSDVSGKVPQMWKAATAKSADEYAKKPVSSIAGTIAAIARPLSSIPVIGAFAKATDIGASAISTIASIFGWTNPPNIANVEPVRQAPYHALASAAISVPGDTLTLDPKAQLTVDPRTVGLADIDEMSISNLVQREAFIGRANWATTDAPQVTLAAAPVQPLHYLRVSNSINGDEISFPPVGLMSRSFGYWRGDIIFRFKIIATEYHRGRLRFSWDPVASLFGSSANNNTSLNRIVDISLEKDIEVRIPYNQARHWLKTPDMLGLGVVPYLRVKGDIFANFVDAETNNGMLTMLVLNALSAPEPTANVDILIFIRGAPNLEFCVPKLPLNRQYSYFAPQAGEISISGNHEDDSDQRQYDVYFGDPVRSIRTLMRRSYPNVSLMADNSGGLATNKLRFYTWMNTIYPYFNGYDPTSNFSATSFLTGSRAYAWALNTPFHMWVPCFKGMRGSMYWHYENECQVNADRASLEISRELIDPSLNTNRLAWNSDGFLIAAGTLNSLAFEETLSYDGQGSLDVRNASTLVSPFNGEGKSILYPNMFNYRFDTTRVTAFVTGQNRPRPRRERIRIMMRYAPRGNTQPSAGNTENNQFIRRYFSIGPDFTVFFFLCVPRIYRYTALPGAV